MAYGTAWLAAIGAVLLSAHHFLETVAWWAAVVALLLWPITLVVGPIVTVLSGEWIVAALFAWSVVAVPVSALVSVMLANSLRDGNWPNVLLVVPAILFLALLLPGAVVRYQLDQRLNSWRPWSALVRSRDEQAGSKFGFSLRPVRLLDDVSWFASHAAVLAIIVWSAVLAFNQGGGWAALAVVVFWPITMFVAPVVSATEGSWTLVALLATTLLAMPLAAALIFRIRKHEPSDSSRSKGTDVG